MMACTPSPWQSPALLPEKVLLQVFTNACIEDRWVRLSRSIRISNVCRYWKRVLLSDESLWVNFNFPHKNSNLAELALSRMNPDTLLDVGLDDIGTPEQDPTGYNFVKDHWSRVWALSIYPSNPDDEYPNILQYIVDNPPTTYTLKKLDMTGDRYCESDFEDETPPPPPADCSAIAERLAGIEAFRSVEQLMLYSVAIPVWGPLYDNLVELDLSEFRPLIPVHQMLDALRRSPGLRSIALEHVLERMSPDTPMESPIITLPSLQKLRIGSSSIHSTVFLMQHIHPPKLNNLTLHAKSDESGAEISRLLGSLQNSPLLLAATKVFLSTGLDEEISLQTHDFWEDYDMPIEIRLTNATWKGQCRAPSFLQLFPNLRRVGLHYDAANVVPMLKDHTIEELVVGGPMETTAFYEMAPGRILQSVRTLELDCWRFSSVFEVGLRALARASSLRLLRLTGWENEPEDRVREFMNFGIERGVWVQWVERDERSSKPKRPPRKERQVRRHYGGSSTDEEGVPKLAGKKRTLDEAEEEPPKPKTIPKRTTMFLPTDFKRHAWGNRFEDPLISRRYDEMMHQTWDDVMAQYPEGFLEEDEMDVD